MTWRVRPRWSSRHARGGGGASARVVVMSQASRLLRARLGPMAAALTFLLFLFAPASSEAQCSVSSSGVAFGTYDVLLTPPDDTTGTVSFSCLLLLLPRITLSTGSSLSFAPRTMKKGAEALSYNLYLDAARSSVWGDGTAGTSYYQPLLALLGGTVTVYGRIPAKQNVSAGNYTDTVVVTLLF